MVLDKFIAESNFNGVLLFSKDEEIIIKKGYGYASFEYEIKNTPDKIFKIASITKQFTAACILKLYEDRLLKLTDTIDIYIPDFVHGERIQIHHLLSNSSGIANFDLNMDFYHILNRENVLIGLIDYIKDKPLMFEPGTKFFYSISGYLVLQYIIELVTRKTYEEYLKSEFLDNLGMKNTGFEYPDRVIKNRAFPYKSNKELAKCFDMRIAGGGGGLYSTIEDLFVWNQALLSHKVLKPETTKMMFTPHIKADEVNSYGYGIIIAKQEDYLRYYHPGGGFGVRSFNAIYPKSGFQYILITNIEDKETFEKVRKAIEKYIEEETK